jgi:hypothetical protein
MIPCPERRRAPGILVGLLMLFLLGPLAAARAAYGSGAAGHRPATARRAPAGAGYPAAASRPQIHPRASELVRPAPARRASSLGAAVAPGRPRRSSGKSRRPVLRGNPARALVGFQAMQKAYLLKHSYLYAGEPFSYLWPFSQAFAATVSMANVPHLGVSLSHELLARVAGLNAYLDPDNSQAPEGTYVSTLPAFDGAVAPPVGPGGPKYYDDNDWVGIELVRLYKLTHIASMLGSAEGILAFEMAGWQASPELGCPGGIPFANTTMNTERNTVTTAPAAELATQLYRITGNAQYLQFAEMAYEWVRRCLLEPSGLYADHIDRQGVVEPQLWSYNQGTMIGAGTLLYQATGNSAYLYQARQTAKAALAYFTPERLASEIPFFPSIYFRNLLYLDSITHDPPGPKVAQAYVNDAWGHLRLRDNLFVAGSPPSAQLLVQAAIVQIYALLSSPPSTYF